MHHINRRCSASNSSLHQMLNRCLFSALLKVSEDLSEDLLKRTCTKMVWTIC